eukprot:TRINITY_DN6232_c0_g1_i1.p1 TRINITY_DN6232_c0_g1~~TRINITY_DN6232_c0_g1_i1.p1  ORF type:complete len:522 (-),score=141.21 TRINITY_DN6232_c0_g1_i1:537-2000(-)
MTNSHKAGHHLLIAISTAHTEIMKGKRDTLEAGTTTLLGGMILQIEEEVPDGRNLLFLCTNIGDCKAFHLCSQTGTVTDLTTSNREQSKSARDPGGRLGPYLPQGRPDLRNLSLSMVRCAPEDIIFVVSDGIHDNLDAEYLGLTPQDIEFPPGVTWKDVGIKEGQQAKTVYRNKLLQYILKGASEPQDIVERLIGHALLTTQSSRDFLITNSKSKLPDDYVKFPGKMDHTTCCCFMAGVADANIRETLKPKTPVSDPGEITLPPIVTQNLDKYTYTKNEAPALPSGSHPPGPINLDLKEGLSSEVVESLESPRETVELGDAMTSSNDVLSKILAEAEEKSSSPALSPHTSKKEKEPKDKSEKDKSEKDKSDKKEKKGKKKTSSNISSLTSPRKASSSSTIEGRTKSEKSEKDKSENKEKEKQDKGEKTEKDKEKYSSGEKTEKVEKNEKVTDLQLQNHSLSSSNGSSSTSAPTTPKKKKPTTSKGTL